MMFYIFLSVINFLTQQDILLYNFKYRKYIFLFYQNQMRLHKYYTNLLWLKGTAKPAYRSENRKKIINS